MKEEKKTKSALEFYKGGKTIKGAATSFTVASKKSTIFVNIIKQTGYNEQTHRGVYQGGIQHSIALGAHECAAIINTIESNEPYETVHPSEKYTSTIKFEKYEKDGKQLGFGLKIFRSEKGNETKENFLIGFSFQEAVLLREWLRFALEKIFSAWYAEAKIQATEYQNKQEAKAAAPVQAATPTPEPAKEAEENLEL